jgi:uncharacterized surface protein with fasciclin (FAS1) repeats
MQNPNIFRIFVRSTIGAGALSLALTACSSDGGEADAGTGGAATGGAAATGGSATTGGGSSTGGASTGGASSGGASSSGGAGSGGDAGGGNDCQTIVELAAATPELSVLVAAVQKAGLVEALGGEDLTVFAPTDAAFGALLDALGLESLDDLSAEQLTPILLYHVLPAVVDADAAIALAGGEGVADTLGGTVTLSVEDSSLVLDTEEASATVTMPDVAACNGVVHVIDGVLLPSILDIVATQASFSELLGLVQASSDPAGLTAVLDGPASDVVASLDPGAFTLFAPTNDAIEALDAAPSAETLTEVLQYHVYAADEAVLAADALSLDAAEIEMLNGETLTVDGGAGVTLTDGQGNDSSVVATDLYASNGVIHRIDGVLLP